MLIARYAKLIACATAIPVVAALVSTCLFVAQHGFGRGHGRFDMAIGLLGCPAILLIERLPVPGFVEQYDLLLIVWFPTLLNLVFFFVVGCAAAAIVNLKASGRS